VLAIENYPNKDRFPILKIFQPVNLGRLELLKKNYAKAAEILTEALIHTQANHRVLLINYRLCHMVYHKWWQQTNDTKKLAMAYDFLQKVNRIEQADAKETVQKRLNAVHGYYELEQ